MTCLYVLCLTIENIQGLPPNILFALFRVNRFDFSFGISLFRLQTAINRQLTLLHNYILKY